MMNDKVVLIAGKDMPEGLEFMRAAHSAKRSVLISASAEEKKTESITPDTSGENEKKESKAAKNEKKIEPEFHWNRSSPISSRAFMVHAENSFGKIDEAVLIFDAQFYEVQFKANRLNHIDFLRSVDELIVGYVFMVMELIDHFTKNGKGTLAFVLKGQNTANAPNLFVAIAQNAFIALAENTVRLHADNANMRIVLVRSDEYSDSETAPWLFSFISDVSAKNTVRWFKVGTKAVGILGFLR